MALRQSNATTLPERHFHTKELYVFKSVSIPKGFRKALGQDLSWHKNLSENHPGLIVSLWVDRSHYSFVIRKEGTRCGF